MLKCEEISGNQNACTVGVTFEEENLWLIMKGLFDCLGDDCLGVSLYEREGKKGMCLRVNMSWYALRKRMQHRGLVENVLTKKGE